MNAPCALPLPPAGPASHAGYLTTVPRPPHDPFTLLLDGRLGWRPLASQPAPGLAPLGADGALTLAPLPGSGRSLLEPSGSFGGLVMPRHATFALLGRCQAALLLYDEATRRLLQFDPCACAFADAFCMRADDPRLPQSFAALASSRGRLYIADRLARRVIVLNATTGALRGQWRAPLATPDGPLADWEPAALSVAPSGDIWVGDRMNGLLLRFSPTGRVRERHEGFGAVSALAVNCAGELLVASEGADAVVFYDPATRRRLDPPARPADVAGQFPPLPLAVQADGALDLSNLCQPPCDPPCAFDASGAPTSAPDAPLAYPASGSWIGAALDSGIADCTWDRIALTAVAPVRTRLAVDVLTAETQLEAADLVESAEWQPALALEGAADAPTLADRLDFMLRAAPGRYLWLRVRMESDGAATPVLARLAIDYPRVSWRRYLPAIFGAEPVSAEFTDRWLALFDRSFRSIESEIDSQARLFDPLSAPSGGKQDFLGFVSSWIGVAGLAALPLPRRRAFVAAIGATYPWRGTPRALTQTLYLFFGLQHWCGYSASNAACVPCPVAIPQRYRWRPPRMLLEHFILRRWLWLGFGRLSDNARLWGERIVNRSRLGAGAPPPPPPGCARPGVPGGLDCIGPFQTTARLNAATDETARLGVTQLKTSQDPLRDPFHVYANQLSLFVPAACLRQPALAQALAHLLKADVPAHVKANLVAVEPRMRVGVQAMLGLDAVIGYRAAPAALDAARLGKGIVLDGANRDGGERALRVGTRRVGKDTTLK